MGSNVQFMTLGQRVKKARELVGLNQKGLQVELDRMLKRLGANGGSGVIERLENRKPPSARSEYTVHIAKICNVDPFWLATGDGEPRLKLEGLSEDAMLVGYAYQHVRPTDLQDRYAHEVLTVALGFIKTPSAEYKQLEALYRKVSKRRGIKADLKREMA